MVLKMELQLRISIRERKAFEDFKEASLTHLPYALDALFWRDEFLIAGLERTALLQGYPPTSLVMTSSASWRLLPISPPNDACDRRKPAWTDRILHIHSKVTTVEQLSYRGHPGVTMSDHRPVSADFVVSVCGTNPRFLPPLEFILCPPSPVRYLEPLRIRDNHEETQPTSFVYGGRGNPSKGQPRTRLGRIRDSRVLGIGDKDARGEEYWEGQCNAPDPCSFCRLGLSRGRTLDTLRVQICAFGGRGANLYVYPWL